MVMGGLRSSDMVGFLVWNNGQGYGKVFSGAGEDFLVWLIGHLLLVPPFLRGHQ